MLETQKFAAILLAAGTSSRFGGSHKLMQPLDGRPLIQHSLTPIIASTFHQTIIVTGHLADQLTPLTQHEAAEIIFNENYQHGMGTSLATGIGALNDDIDAAFIFLADMPDITAEIIERLTAAFTANPTATICTPTHNGQRGHPVIFARQHFAALSALTGDNGAKAIIRDNTGTLLELPVNTPAILRDIDTPHDLAVHADTGTNSRNLVQG